MMTWIQSFAGLILAFTITVRFVVADSNEGVVKALVVADGGSLLKNSDGDCELTFSVGTDLACYSQFNSVGVLHSLAAVQCTSTNFVLDQALPVQPLRFLDLTLSDVEESLQNLPMDSTVEQLILNGTKVVDFSFITKLSRLRELSVAHTEFSDTDLQYLENHKSLSTLDISGSEVTPEGIAACGRLPSLRFLRAGGLGIDGTNYAGLLQLGAGTEVVLNSPGLTPPEDSESGLPRDALRTVRDAGLIVRGTVSPVTKHEVELEESGGNRTTLLMTWDEFFNFKEPERVIGVDLSRSGLDDVSAASLVRYTNIERLSVRGTMVKDRVWRTFAQLERLRLLDISDTRLSDAGIGDHLEKPLDITELDADNSRITAVNLEEFRFPKLRKVALLRLNPRWPTVDHFPTSTTAGIRTLLNHPQLEEIAFSWGPRVDRDVFLWLVSQTQRGRRIQVFDFKLGPDELIAPRSLEEILDDSTRGLFGAPQ